MKRPIESDYTSFVAYARALEQYCDEAEKQEPVAWMMVNPEHPSQSKSLHWEPKLEWHISWKAVPLYTHPPKREWVGLTQTQVKLLFEGVQEEAVRTGESINWVFYTYINEALKEKNA